jgi:hypothetical protein
VKIMVQGQSIAPNYTTTMVLPGQTSNQSIAPSSQNYLNQAWQYLNSLQASQNSMQGQYERSKLNDLQGYSADLPAPSASSDPAYQQMLVDAERKKQEWNASHGPITGGAVEIFTSGIDKFGQDLNALKLQVAQNLNVMRNTNNPETYLSAEQQYKSAKSQYDELSKTPVSEIKNKYQDEIKQAYNRGINYAQGWGVGGRQELGGISKIEAEQQYKLSTDNQNALAKAFEGKNLSQGQVEDYINNVKSTSRYASILDAYNANSSGQGLYQNKEGLTAPIPSGVLSFINGSDKNLPKSQSDILANWKPTLAFPEVVGKEADIKKILDNPENYTNREVLSAQNDYRKLTENNIGLSSQLHHFEKNQGELYNIPMYNFMENAGDTSLSAQRFISGIDTTSAKKWALPTNLDYSNQLQNNKNEFSRQFGLPSDSSAADIVAAFKNNPSMLANSPYGSPERTNLIFQAYYPEGGQVPSNLPLTHTGNWFNENIGQNPANLDQNFKISNTGITPGSLNVISQSMNNIKTPFLSTAMGPQQNNNNDFFSGAFNVIKQTPLGATLWGNETEKAQAESNRQRLGTYTDVLGIGMIGGNTGQSGKVVKVAEETGVFNKIANLFKKAPAEVPEFRTPAERDAGKIFTSPESRYGEEKISNYVNTFKQKAETQFTPPSAKIPSIQEVSQLRFTPEGGEKGLIPLTTERGVQSIPEGMRFSRATETSLLPVENIKGTNIANTAKMGFKPTPVQYGEVVMKPVEDLKSYNFGISERGGGGIGKTGEEVLTEQEKAAKALGAINKEKQMFSFLPALGVLGLGTQAASSLPSSGSSTTTEIKAEVPTWDSFYKAKSDKYEADVKAYTDAGSNDEKMYNTLLKEQAEMKSLNDIQTGVGMFQGEISKLKAADEAQKPSGDGMIPGFNTFVRSIMPEQREKLDNNMSPLLGSWGDGEKNYLLTPLIGKERATALDEATKGPIGIIQSIYPTSPRYMRETYSNVRENPEFGIPAAVLPLALVGAGTTLRTLGVGEKVLAPTATSGKVYSAVSKGASAALAALFADYVSKEATGSSLVDIGSNAYENSRLRLEGKTPEKGVIQKAQENFIGWDQSAHNLNRLEMEALIGLGSYKLAQKGGDIITGYQRTRNLPALPKQEEVIIPGEEGFPVNPKIGTRDLVSSFLKGKISTVPESKLTSTKFSGTDRPFTKADFPANPQKMASPGTTDIFSGAEYPHLNEGYIGAGHSEIPGMSTSPTGLSYFTKAGTGIGNTFGITNDILGLYRRPTMYAVGVKSGEYTEIPKDVLNTPTGGKSINDPTNPRNIAIGKWIKESNAPYEKPIIGQHGKAEFEFHLREGAEVKTKPAAYYKEGGVRIPIERVELTGKVSPKYVEPLPAKEGTVSKTRNYLSELFGPKETPSKAYSPSKVSYTGKSFSYPTTKSSYLQNRETSLYKSSNAPGYTISTPGKSTTTPKSPSSPSKFTYTPPPYISTPITTPSTPVKTPSSPKYTPGSSITGSSITYTPPSYISLTRYSPGSSKFNYSRNAFGAPFVAPGGGGGSGGRGGSGADIIVSNEINRLIVARGSTAQRFSSIFSGMIKSPIPQKPLSKGNMNPIMGKFATPQMRPASFNKPQSKPKPSYNMIDMEMFSPKKKKGRGLVF